MFLVVLKLEGETKYEDNAASEGGAVNVHNARSVKLNCAQFHRNVATGGGGGAIKSTDCQDCSVGSFTNCATSFTSNVAIFGGAVSLESGTYIVSIGSPQQIRSYVLACLDTAQ